MALADAANIDLVRIASRHGKNRLRVLLQEIGGWESGGGSPFEAKVALSQWLASREIGHGH